MNTNVARPAGMVNPILLEVMKSALDTIADEMALIMVLSAYSGIVRDAMDFSTAICDAKGRTLAQGLTTPLHLGSFPDAMKALTTAHGATCDPEDVFIFNDPYVAGGQHLPDIYIVKPIFVDGQLWAWAATLAHHNDVGGLVPGSNSIGSTEIFQEGLRLPILKLYDAGKQNDSIWAIIGLNVRVPDKVHGDLRAQVAGCNGAVRSFTELYRRYGSATMAFYLDEIHNYAERLARAEFAEIPDGVYEFTNHIDGIGKHPEPICFHVKLTVSGSEIEVDWAGTSPQIPAGINAPLTFAKAASYAALRSVLSSEVPNSEGFTRPIRVIAPVGCLVNPHAPAACGARGISGFRMIDCLFGALAQAVPDKVPADGCGGSTLPAFGGYHEGKPFVFVETLMGNYGAAPTHDGSEAVAHVGANQSNIPIEMIEAEQPLRIEQYGFVADSGGPGQFRGGLSLVRDYRLLADEAILTIRSDKRRFPPFGLRGGKNGTPSLNVVNPDGNGRVLPVLLSEPETLHKGDLYRHIMAGGGGFGDPCDRLPDSVLADVIADKVSIERAAIDYGVIITTQPYLSVDEAATQDRRTGMRAEVQAP